MTVQAVFFDMGGTIETFCYTRELRLKATPGIQQLLRNAGIDLGLTNEQLYEVITAGLMRYREVSIKSMEEYPPQRVWSEYILAGYPFEPAKLAYIAEDLMFYIETRYYHRQMRPEMPVVLETIMQMGLKIGLISNVCSREQVPTNLTEYNIRHYFNPVVLSCEYGRRKPDPSIFHYAARLANVPTGECVHVGDRLVRDIQGARKAGFHLTVQIRHGFNQNEDDQGPLPDHVISCMTELLGILREELDRSGQNATRDQKSRRKILAFLFDAGDILYFRPHRGRKLTAFIKELGLKGQEDHTVEINSLKHQAYQGQINQDQYREAILRLYGVSQPEDIERGKRIIEEEDNNVRFFKGVRKTLIGLKGKGYLLGIVTDTANPVHVKLNWFERGGFGHVWDSIVSSKELGVRKPNPEIYHTALQQLGLHAEQVAFVGHKASELEGARAVGMKTIAFNYEDGVEADYYIVKFLDLLDSPLVEST